MAGGTPLMTALALPGARELVTCPCCRRRWWAPVGGGRVCFGCWTRGHEHETEG